MKNSVVNARFSVKEKRLIRQLYNELAQVKRIASSLLCQDTSVLVLTVNINKYDSPLTALAKCTLSKDVVYLVVTDDASAKGYNVVNVGPYLSKEDGVLASRFFKFFTYAYLELFRYVVYVDSSYDFEENFLLNFNSFIELLPKSDLYFYEAFPCRSALEELFYCAECGKISGFQISRVILFSILTSFPSLNPITIDGSFFILHGNKRALAKVFHKTFIAYWKILRRDQPFLASACEHVNLKTCKIVGNSAQNYFGAYRLSTHSSHSIPPPSYLNKTKSKIHYLLYSKKQSKILNLLRLVLLLLKP